MPRKVSARRSLTRSLLRTPGFCRPDWNVLTILPHRAAPGREPVAVPGSSTTVCDTCTSLSVGEVNRAVGSQYLRAGTHATAVPRRRVGPFCCPFESPAQHRSAGTLADVPSSDDDLDWLYGRDKPSPSAPEPTQVMPDSFGLSGRHASSPMPPYPPDPPRSVPQQLGGQQVGAPQMGARQAAPEQSAPVRHIAQYSVGPVSTDRDRADRQAYQDWRQRRRRAGSGPARPRWTRRAHREGRGRASGTRCGTSSSSCCCWSS